MPVANSGSAAVTSTPPSQPAIDPAYQRGAEAVYAAEREAAVETAKMAATYGKWLISTLLLLNAGAITGILTYLAATSSQGADPSLYIPALWRFTFGIMLALACGFATWVNLDAAARAHAHYANPWMLTDQTKFRSERAPGYRKLMTAYWASIFLGWLCAASLLWGAYLVSHALGG